MNSLAEKLSVKQAPVYQGEPVKAEKAGRVQWAAIDGARVQAWDTLAEIAGNYGTSVIGCNASGILAHVAKNGEPVLAGQVVAYVKPVERAQTRQSVQPAPTVAPIAKAPQRQPSEAQQPVAQPAPLPIVQPAPTRRSTMPPAMELTILEEEPVTPPAPKKRLKVKVQKWTWHPTNTQKATINDRLESLKARGFDYGIGELQRVAAEWLATVDERELVELMEAQRDREVAGRYGYGSKPQ